MNKRLINHSIEIRNNKKKILIFLFWIFFFPQQIVAIENKILLKIDQEIITTIDVMNEFNYLSILNKKFQKLPKTKALEIAKNSIIRDEIKKIELEKNINLNNVYKKSNNELNLKLDELDELKKYKYKYLEYKQKNTDLET